MQNETAKLARTASWLFLLIFFFLCSQITFLLAETIHTQQTNHQLCALKNHTAADTAQDPFQPLREINHDFSGWLSISETSANLPVVLGHDNNWYLSHNFHGEEDRHGTLFLDACTDPSIDGNLIIYGHNMKDNTMFGELDFFKRKSFFEENGLVRWETSQSCTYYQIFAGLVIPGSAADAGYLDLTAWANSISDVQAEQMLKKLHSKAALWRNVQHTSGDRYLFLVTCDYTKTNGRWVLVAQSLSEEDTKRIKDMP